MLKQRRLFWIAVGAGAGSVVWLLAYFVLAYMTRDKRVLEIAFENYPELHEQVIAAVVECKGRFEMDLSSHGDVIKIPLNTLDSADYACLIDKVDQSIVFVDKPPTSFRTDGKFLVRPELRVTDPFP